MSVHLSTLPSLVVIGTVVLLGSTGAAIGGALITDPDTTGGAVTIEDVRDTSSRTVDLARDDRVKLRRTKERGSVVD